MIKDKIEEILNELKDLSFEIDNEVMHTGNKSIIIEDMKDVLKISTDIIIEATEVISKLGG